MAKEYLFDKISDLKERFKSFFQHRKKITALENFSECDKFPHKSYLTLIKGCMTEGFLGDEESKFLDHMLNKYEVNYLDWAHRTKWLKKQIAKKAAENPLPAQTYFNFDKQQASPVNVPIELLIQQHGQMTQRI